MSRCIILGAADMPHDFNLPEFIRPDDFIICADGGLYHAQRHKLIPHLIMGDFDSYTDLLPDVETLRFAPRKDDTDMMLAVKEGLRRGYRHFLLFGGIGDRLDHTFANLCALYYLLEQDATGELIDARNTAMMIRNNRIRLSRKQDCALSILPFAGAAQGVTLRGMEYPLNGETLLPSDPLGVSNRIVEDAAEITVKEGTLLIIFAKE